jgi:protein-L-isoaspartate O-methyltransferase
LDEHARHFDSLYREHEDPWNYRHSRRELLKRRMIVEALGPGRHARGLEIGCSNGISTAALAPRFLRLLAIDASRRAVDLASRRVRSNAQVRVEQRMVPDELPRGPFDAIIASEVLYYLPRPILLTTLRRIGHMLCRGGLLVTCQTTRSFNDTDITPAALKAALTSSFGRPHHRIRHTDWELLAFRAG